MKKENLTKKLRLLKGRKGKFKKYKTYQKMRSWERTNSWKNTKGSLLRSSKSNSSNKNLK